MDNERGIHNDKTVLSPHTNKPISTKVVSPPPIFWCETCDMKLTTPTIAFQHLNGRVHKSKINAKQNTRNDQSGVKNLNHAFDALSINKSGAVNQNSTTKKNKGQQTKTNTSVVQELTNKKNKEQSTKPVVPDPLLTCDDCNLVFDSAIIAIQHLKGKKHIAQITAKITAKQRDTQRGVRGRSRGDFFGRGRGGVTRPINNFHGRIDNDFDSARYDFFFNPQNQIRNNYTLQHNDYCSNSPPNYRTSQRDDYDEHFNSANGDSPRGRGSSPPNEYYLDYDSLSSTKDKKKNKYIQGGQRGGKWQRSKGRGYAIGQPIQGYQGGYLSRGITRGSQFGNGIGRGDPSNSTWWCKYFVRGTSMKGNS